MFLFRNIIYILLVSALSSCSKTAIMRIKVMEPGGITIAPHIKSIAVIDRSIPPSKKDKNVIGIFTGENANRDREAVQQLMAGLNDQLRTTSRYDLKITSIQMTGLQNGGVFPAPLEKNIIDQICKDHQVDAVLSLEEFSARCALTTAEKVVDIATNTVKNGVGNVLQTVLNSPTMQYSATQTATIKIGFRLYDQSTFTIADQHAFTWTNSWSTAPTNDVHGAITGAMADNIAIQKVCYDAGVNYGLRIAPSWLWLNRVYYRRSKNYDMAVAARMAITRDWEGAIEVWKRCEKTLKRAKAGRAAFNLALGYEVMGDLEQAQQWCQKSYVVYRNKNARQYSEVLRQRIWEIQKLKQQMEKS